MGYRDRSAMVTSDVHKWNSSGIALWISLPSGKTVHFQITPRSNGLGSVGSGLHVTRSSGWCVAPGGSVAVERN